MLAVSMSPPVAHFPPVQKRPKLSLQTSALPISYGTSSRNLSLIANPASAVTPTTLNTLSNTFDLTHRPSPTSTTSSPSILRTLPGRDRSTRSQSPRPKRLSEKAYPVSLPFGIKPILRNAPFQLGRTNSFSASPRPSARKAFFPAPRRVAFKNPIEEEIVTKVYTARHSDLLEIEGEADVRHADENEANVQESPSPSSTVEKPSSGNDTYHLSSTEIRQTDLAEPDFESESIATPAHARKRRRWEWTLGPLPTGQPAEDRARGVGKTALPPRSDSETATESAELVLTTQKRAGSLDASPRKRKADCLEQADDKAIHERRRAATV